MVSIQAEAKLYALDASSASAIGDAKCRSCTISFDIFQEEWDLGAQDEPPVKKRKLGWIPAEDGTTSDSVTLSYLNVDFVSIHLLYYSLYLYNELTEEIESYG